MGDAQNEETKFLACSPEEWTVSDVMKWIDSEKVFSSDFYLFLRDEKIDGRAFLELKEQDFRDDRIRRGSRIKLGEVKRILRYVSDLKMKNGKATSNIDNHESINSQKKIPSSNHSHHHNDLHAMETIPSNQEIDLEKLIFEDDNSEKSTPKAASLGSKCIPPDVFKTALSLAYSFLVTWITSFVMVIVHERVPDMKRYPPLPDIFLDNVPHIPWAFHMCEITGTLLFLIWSSVCIFHKHRLVLLRRFFALAGTVFLLRCVTMLITSLSVPGTHLQCNQKDYAVDDTSMSFIDSLEVRVSRAYSIWSGLGMSIQGVRTCGDYMFSGHTVALTLLNFFITEYTPRNLYFLHTLTWLLNMFGIFFILAAHEHYSIDVFVAFYITSRLFLYYHTLANNQALMSRDSNRTRIWFPMFSYFESSVEGIIPNEYDSLSSLFDIFVKCFIYIKDSIVMFVQRIWIESHKMTAPNQKNTALYTKIHPKFIENYQFKQDAAASLFNNDDITKRRSLQTKDTSSEHKSKELHESIDCKKSQ